MKDLIRKGKRRLPARMIVYGNPKIGKSTFAAGAPRPIFVPTEDGIDEIDCESLPLSNSYDEFMSKLEWLATSEDAEGYESIVIDSLDWLEKLIHKQCIKGVYVSGNQIKSFTEIPYGKGPDMALGYWQEVIKALNFFREDKGMNVICISHARVAKVSNPEGDNYDRFELALDKLAAAKMTEWAYAIGFASVNQRVEKIGKGFNERTVAKPIGANGGERVLRLTGSPACNAGNRYGIVGEIPLSWEAFEQARNS